MTEKKIEKKRKRKKIKSVVNDEKIKKLKRIPVRVSDEDKKKIEERAASANQNVSEFMRQAALKKKIRNYKNVIPLYIEIQRIGNNINQAVKLMNTFGVAEERDLIYLLKEFNIIKKKVEEFINDGDSV